MTASTTTNAPSEPAAPALFARRSSGLVREISPLGALAGSMGIFNLAVAAFTLALLPFTFPGSNLILSTLIAIVPAVLLGAIYMLLGVAMPRSGGEYIFNSRALHPAIGYASNFNWVVWTFAWFGIYANWMVTIGLSGLFGSIGTITGSKSWNNLAVDMSKHWVVFTIGIASILLAVLLITNLRQALRVMKILFALSLAGFLVLIVGTLVISHSSYVAHVNKVGSYNGIIHLAAKNGFTAPKSWHEFGPILSGVALMVLSTLFVFSSTYAGGEIKNVKRSFPIAIFGTLAIGCGVLLIMAVAAAKTWGHTFIAAMQTVSTNAPGKYPFSASPNFGFLASLGIHSTVFAFVVNAGFVLMIFLGLVFVALTQTRCLFAWSMDRLVPDQLSAVSRRTHSPTLTLVLTAVLGIAALAIFTYTSFSTFIGGTTLGFLSTFITTSITAMVFPYRRKDLYEQSPLKPRVWGVPLLSVVGALSTACLIAIAYAYISNKYFGANSFKDYMVLAGGWVVGMAYYWVARGVRLRQGVPLDIATASLPPE